MTLYVVLVPAAGASTTWYVDGVSGSDVNNCISPETACKTIGHAISLASSGDSIIVAPATYTEKNLGIAISLNIIGSGARTTIIDGQAAGPVIVISSPAQVTLSNITIRNGLSGRGGGILMPSGTLTLNNSTVSGNKAFPNQRQQGFGGGIYNAGRLTINNSTITGNTAWCGGLCSGNGGGIYNATTLIINNTTVTGNVAGGFFFNEGGGIYNYYGTVTMNNSTVSRNSASYRAASYRGIGDNVYSKGGSVTLQNTIVAKGTSENCFGTMTSNGYNLSSDNTCNFNSRGDLNNHDPLLGPLQNNGGPTDTMALLPGSPALDAGNPTGCTDGQGNLLKTDQRGMPRPDKEDSVGCDIGAYENQSD
jgi:hypothetical protein